MVSAGRPPDGSTDIVSLLALVFGGNNAFLVVSEFLHVMNTIPAPLALRNGMTVEGISRTGEKNKRLVGGRALSYYCERRSL
jgi:hypothetical protein